MVVRKLLWRDRGTTGKQGSFPSISLTLCSSVVSSSMFCWSCTSHDLKFETFTLLSRMPLQRSGKDFTIMKVLPSGVYQYRFIVDGQWRYAPELPWAQDDVGAAYNILDLQVCDLLLIKRSCYCSKRLEMPLPWIVCLQVGVRCFCLIYS